MEQLSDTVRMRKLKLTGHILHLPQERPASTTMNWVLDGSKWCHGRSSKTWQTTFNEDHETMKLT